MELADVEAVVPDVRSGLAMMLGKEADQVLVPRENAQGQISVIDVFMALTGKKMNEAAGDVRRMRIRFPELSARIGSFKFPGRGQRDTPVADLATMTEIVLVIPGFKAIFVRVEASKLILRLIRGEPQESDLMLQQILFHNETLAMQ